MDSNAIMTGEMYCLQKVLLMLTLEKKSVAEKCINGTRTHNLLVCKRTLNHLAKLAK